MVKRVRFAAALLLMFALGLGGCAAVGPDYQRVADASPAAWKEAPPSGWKEAAPRDDISRGNWWEVFGDPVLNDLETQAETANQSLKAAVARVMQARAIARSTEADFFPRVDFAPSVLKTQQSANRPVEPTASHTNYSSTVFGMPFDLTYELDIWGKVRRAFEAANADARASEAACGTILLTLQSDVARTYYNLRYIDDDLAILRNNLAVLERSLDLVLVRYRGGIASGLDVSQAETILASTRAQCLGVSRQRAQLEHALAVLVGKPPSEFSLPENAMHLVPPAIPPGLPSDLLERRPDIAEAERAMAASNARIGVAKAAFFPSVSLTGNAGQLSIDLNSLMKGQSFTWFAGPSLSLPVLDGGRISANLKRARAAYDESVANYRQQVLVAFKEVEDALSDLRILEDQARAQERAVQAAQRTREISTSRYKQGAALYLEVLDGQRAVLLNEQLGAQIRGLQLVASVQLVKALGGGWQGPGLNPDR